MNVFAVKNVPHKMELTSEAKMGSQKSGELNITLNGINVKMENFPVRPVQNGLTNGTCSIYSDFNTHLS